MTPLIQRSEVSPFVLAVQVSVDPEVDDIFNNWYTNVHLKEIVEVPGFRWGHRFHAVESVVFPLERDHQTYLALYGIDDLASLESPEFHDASGSDLPTKGWHPEVADRLRGKRINVYQGLGGWERSG